MAVNVSGPDGSSERALRFASKDKENANFGANNSRMIAPLSGLSLKLSLSGSDHDFLSVASKSCESMEHDFDYEDAIQAFLGISFSTEGLKASTSSTTEDASTELKFLDQSTYSTVKTVDDADECTNPLNIFHMNTDSFVEDVEMKKLQSSLGELLANDDVMVTGEGSVEVILSNITIDDICNEYYFESDVIKRDSAGELVEEDDVPVELTEDFASPQRDREKALINAISEQIIEVVIRSMTFDENDKFFSSDAAERTDDTKTSELAVGGEEDQAIPSVEEEPAVCEENTLVVTGLIKDGVDEVSATVDTDEARSQLGIPLSEEENRNDSSSIAREVTQEARTPCEDDKGSVSETPKGGTTSIVAGNTENSIDRNNDETTSIQKGSKEPKFSKKDVSNDACQEMEESSLPAIDMITLHFMFNRSAVVANQEKVDDSFQSHDASNGSRSNNIEDLPTKCTRQNLLLTADAETLATLDESAKSDGSVDKRSTPKGNRNSGDFDGSTSLKYRMARAMERSFEIYLPGYKLLKDSLHKMSKNIDDFEHSMQDRDERRISEVYLSHGWVSPWEIQGEGGNDLLMLPFGPPPINAVSAAASLTSGSLQRKRMRTASNLPQHWRKPLERRTKPHPGYSRIDKKTLHRANSITGEPPHRLDHIPWEYRDVKQFFLCREDLVRCNWFGTCVKKRFSSRHRLPICHPKSLATSLLQPAVEWMEDWYTTWQSRKDDVNTLINDTQECSDLQENVLGQHAEEVIPRVGTICTIRLKVGEHVSKIHHDHTSRLRRSRWRRKFFPKGSFPY